MIMDAMPFQQSNSLTRYNPTPDILLGKSDPVIFARSVGEGMRSGVRSVIKACVQLRDAVKLFEGDPSLLDQFRRALVDENVIPKRSARLGNVENSKLSMLRTIGERANLLLDDQVFRFLEPGYSVLYHVVRLYDDLPGDHQQRTSRLVELFEAQGGLSREFLIDQISLLKQAREANETEAPDPWDDKPLQKFDLVLMAPVVRNDLRRLAENYGDGDRGPLCLNFHQRVAKDAVGIVIARMVDLPMIENKMLPGCGFASISRILIPHAPLSPDVTDVPVLVIATRGRPQNLCVETFDWLPHDQVIAPVSLAAQLAPNAKNRVHLFAPAKLEGWCTIRGDANWEPTDE
jgi:hypothetical protein